MKSWDRYKAENPDKTAEQRIAELEAELAAAKARIVELEGEIERLELEADNADEERKYSE